MDLTSLHLPSASPCKDLEFRELWILITQITNLETWFLGYAAGKSTAWLIRQHGSCGKSSKTMSLSPTISVFLVSQLMQESARCALRKKANTCSSPLLPELLGSLWVNLLSCMAVMWLEVQAQIRRWIW